VISVCLRSRTSRVVFALVLFLPAIVLMVCVFKLAIAATLGRSMGVDRVRMGLALDSGNPEIQHRLGWLESTTDMFEGLGASPKAMGDLRRSVALAPAEPSYWSDLATACESTGDLPCATQAFGQAESLDPAAPRMHWLVANYDLRAGKTEESLAEFRKTLELDPEYAGPTFQICLQVLGDPAIVSERVIPPGKRSQLALPFANFLCETGYPDAAFGMWREIASRGEQFSFADVIEYLQRLTVLSRFSDVRAVWTELARRRLLPATNEPSENLVYNGGFETTPLRAGFDWYYSQPPYVVVDPLAGMAHHGSRCLRLEFPVKRNEECEAAYEFVPVEPGQEYELSAFVRSEAITSDAGPTLRITDAIQPEDLRAAAETTVGTTPWHQISVIFTTTPRTRVVRLSVWRPRSRTYPTEISGSFWLDDVKLRPLSSDAGELTNK